MYQVEIITPRGWIVAHPITFESAGLAWNWVEMWGSHNETYRVIYLPSGHSCSRRDP